jgi:hypothetical protein
MELSKMPDRWNRQVVSQTVDVLFESAQKKVTDEHSKAVLANLRSLVF